MDRDELIELMARAIENELNEWVFHVSPEAIEAGLRAAFKVMDQAGFVIVPREPTEAMLSPDFRQAIEIHGDSEVTVFPKRVWRLMIEASQEKIR